MFPVTFSSAIMIAVCFQGLDYCDVTKASGEQFFEHHRFRLFVRLPSLTTLNIARLPSTLDQSDDNGL